MANEDEVVQQFKVEAGNSVQVLGGIASGNKEVEKAVESVKKATKGHSEVVKQHGEHQEHLHAHLSHTRHELHLLSEATGVARGGMMTMLNSVTTLGPAIGFAVGAFILLKDSLSEYGEKLKEVSAKDLEFQETLKEHRKVARGSEYEGKAESANDEIKTINKEMSELKKSKDWDIADEGWAGSFNRALDSSYQKAYDQYKALEKVREELEQTRDLYQSINERKNELERETLTRESTQEAALTAEAKNAEKLHELAEAKKKAEMYDYIPRANLSKERDRELTNEGLKAKAAYNALKNAQTEGRHEAEKAHDEALSNPSGRVVDPYDRQAVLAESHRMKEAKGDEELAHKKRDIMEKAYLSYAEKVEEIDDLIHRRDVERANETAEYKKALAEETFKHEQELKEINNSPSVFATEQQKRAFAEDKRYNAEKFKASNTPGADMGIVEQRHIDEQHKAQIEAENELSQRRAAIKSKTLQNDGDHFESEKTMVVAHYQDMLLKHTGYESMQKLDTEEYNADIEKLTIEHNNEVASYTSNLKSESLRIKGDQYGAEREALEEWQRKELDSHKDQATQIKAMHAQRAADITRREKEEHTKVLGGYAVELSSALLGSGVGGVQRMMLEHQEKQAEYKRTGHSDYADAEQAAYSAKINRMKLESDAELQSKNRVGFSDVAGGWESFASSLNQNPMQQMQLNEQKATNQILREIQQANRSGAELVN